MSEREAQVQEHELHEMDAEERRHFIDSPPKAKRTEMAGQHYRCWGRTYELASWHPCGFHMKPVDHEGRGRWHCISERAIGRSYHRAWRDDE